MEKITNEKLIYNLFFNEKPTQIQKAIEGVVTRGMGYDTKTEYVVDKSEKQILYDLFERPEIHDTWDGLQIHLAELDARVNPSNRLDGIIERYKKLAVDKAKLPMAELVDRINIINYNKEVA